LVLEAPCIAPEVRPGQFVHIKIPHLEQCLLRRPFSVYQAAGGRISILYKDVGTGTRAMTMLAPGDSISLIGPLGRPFPVHQPAAFPVLIAGGYGMAALYMVARSQPSPGMAFFGGAGRDDILCVEEFTELGWDVRAATEDGSLGIRGLVTDALDPWLRTERAGRTPEFFACGPNAMLKAIADRARQEGWTAWVSVDRNMGCGVGACLTCVLKVATADGRDWTWARACTEGPVFNAADVVWDT
jgi:dihydroorotate dehydrogenase electron transfer subunit